MLKESRNILLADRVEQSMVEDIGRLIRNHESLLPQQQELAERYGVSLQTIRTVVDRLKERRMIRSVKGKGMFILPAAKETGNILVVTDRLEHPYTSMVVASVSNVLLQQNLTPVLADPTDLERSSADVRGVLLISDGPEAKNFLTRSKLPYCAINDVFDLSYEQSVHHQTVRNNNYLWCFALTEMLLLGGKDKVFFFTSMSELACGREKIRGYRDALRYYGKEYDERYVINVPRDNEPTVDEFCATTRALIEQESRRYPGKVGFVDTSGTMTYPQSMFYHRIVENVVNVADVAVGDYMESPKAFMTKLMVVTSLNQIVGRAVDLIMGRSRPFSICETIDDLQVKVNEFGIWRQYDYREYIARFNQQ